MNEIKGYWLFQDGMYTWEGDDWEFEENSDGTLRMPLDVLSMLMEVQQTKIDKSKLH